MYRALLVRELQQQIFENFLPSFDVESLTFAEADSFVKYLPDREARKTLLNAALTCRNLKEAALDALWWAVDDLTPLCAMLEGFRETEDSVAVRHFPLCLRNVAHPLHLLSTHSITWYAALLQDQRSIGFSTMRRGSSCCTVVDLLPSRAPRICGYFGPVSSVFYSHV